jgi:hypothetical protein
MALIRFAGSGSPTGTSNRISVTRFPPIGSVFVRRLVGIVRCKVADRDSVLLVMSAQRAGHSRDKAGLW